jgi:hypothetical protein
MGTGDRRDVGEAEEENGAALLTIETPEFV